MNAHTDLSRIKTIRRRNTVFTVTTSDNGDFLPAQAQEYKSIAQAKRACQGLSGGNHRTWESLERRGQLSWAKRAISGQGQP